MTQQFCEDCLHAQIDGPHDKYHGTMTSCNKKMQWHWNKKDMDYYPNIKPCPCYQEDDSDCLSESWGLDHPIHNRDTMTALIEIDEMLKSGQITIEQIRELAR